jgi:hypothetical protein
LAGACAADSLDCDKNPAGSGKTLLMAWPIVDAVIGLVLAAAAIGIPQWVSKRRRRSDADTQAYMKETGRSAQDIAQSNAAELRRENEARSRQASGSDGPRHQGGAGSGGS